MDKLAYVICTIKARENAKQNIANRREQEIDVRYRMSLAFNSAYGVIKGKTVSTKG